MFRYILLFIINLFVITSIVAADLKPVTIGIVVPIQHRALDEMVDGFKKELIKDYPNKIKFVVQNAQGDINLQRSIIQKFNQDETKLIVAVARPAMQMASTMVTKKPIISLAAALYEEQRQQRSIKNITNVDDESAVIPGINFFFATVPDLHKVTIVHTSADKIMSQLVTFKKMAQEHRIEVQDIMIQQLSELYSASSRIAEDSQAVFILKDNLIASGINTLINIANNRKLPLIASDGATVESGAAFAVGFKEEQIGAEGAKIAARVLKGEDVSTIPVKFLDKKFLFINKEAVQKQNLNLNRIIANAKKYKYEVVVYGVRK